MEIKLLLCVTHKKDAEIHFLLDGDMPVMKPLEGVSYQDANKLFEDVFGYYPYPFCMLQQIGYVDDVTDDALLVYYARLDNPDFPKIGRWVDINELTKRKDAYLLYSKCLIERKWSNVV